MDKTEKQLRAVLGKTMENINADSFLKTISAAERELQAREIEKGCRQRMDFRRFFLWQVRHSGIKIWLIQGILLMCVTNMLLALFRHDRFLNQKHVAVIFCGFAVFVFMSAIPLVYRTQRYKMAEIEAAAYFSVIHLLFAKLLMAGLGDAVMIGVVFGMTVIKTSLDIGNICFYFTVPFLMICCAGIGMVRYKGLRRLPYGCMGICICIVIFVILFNQYFPAYYNGRFSMEWLCICGGLLLLCGHHLRYMMYCGKSPLF